MTFFHIIDNFTRGGAETLLYHVVKNLKNHRHYIITLTSANHFSPEELKGLQLIVLDFKSMLSLPGTVWRLRQLIRKHQPDIIHAHLPLASLVSSLATPKRMKLFVSVHNTYSESLQKVSPRLFWLEKKLHSRRDRLLFVSAAIREDYQRIIGIKGQSFVLYNFIADKFFNPVHQRMPSGAVPAKHRLVSVGSLKRQKNFDTLIRAFSLLDNSKFSLDIFGVGAEKPALEQLIIQYGLTNVHLRGGVPDIEARLKDYDAFILASRYEGFGIAPLEAAAVGLPLLLSDIGVFREVTKDYATYFSPSDEKDIAATIMNYRENYISALETSKIFRPTVQRDYSREAYLQKLLNIYQHE